MDRISKTLLLALTLLSAGSASAAIFDSMESVDQLKVIAAQQTTKTDRMPAGKEIEAAQDGETENTNTASPSKEN